MPGPDIPGMDMPGIIPGMAELPLIMASYPPPPPKEAMVPLAKLAAAMRPISRLKICFTGAL